MRLQKTRIEAYIEDIEIEIELIFRAMDDSTARYHKEGEPFSDLEPAEFNGKQTTIGALWKMINDLGKRQDVYKQMITEIENAP